MKHEKAFDYLPAQRMRYLREELRRLQGRFALAEDPALIEALIYEQASLLRQQSPVCGRPESWNRSAAQGRRRRFP